MNDLKSKIEKPETELMDSYRIFLTEKIARNIAHEIRNPLTNIMLGLDQLNNEFSIEEKESAAIYYNIIKRNCDRINELISSLVNAAKPPDLIIANHSVNTLMDEALAITDDKIRSGKVTIQRKYDLQLPSIAVDGEKIKSAFSNIILNALRAMEGKAGILEIKTEFEDKKCIIKFSDNGIGINKEDISRIFDPFFRVKSTGAGLGLTTTQNIIHNHKGIIKADSILGVGTTFTVSFSLLN